MLSRLTALDLALYRFARTAGHRPGTEHAARAFTGLGQHAAVWLAIGAIGAGLDRPRRRRWRRSVATVAGAYGLNTAIKLLVRRPRPDVTGLGPLVRTPTQLSFPSAHATSSFAGARAYSGLLPSAPLYVLASGLALSRVYLGVHYPSDVAAGAALGSFLGALAR